MGIDDEIAAAWPRRWAKANDSSRPGASKRRNTLRRAWREAKALEAFRISHPGAACRNCKNCAPYPHKDDGTLICELDSDFHGYAITDPDDLCVWWKRPRAVALDRPVERAARGAR